VLDHYENVRLVTMNIGTEVYESEQLKSMAEVFASSIISFLFYYINIHVFISKRSTSNGSLKRHLYLGIYAI
jgi:hypothetical protein